MNEDEFPPENMIFQNVEDWIYEEDMVLPEYNFYAQEYWQGEDTEDDTE